MYFLTLYFTPISSSFFFSCKIKFPKVHKESNAQRIHVVNLYMIPSKPNSGHHSLPPPPTPNKRSQRKYINIAYCLCPSGVGNFTYPKPILKNGLYPYIILSTSQFLMCQKAFQNIRAYDPNSLCVKKGFQNHMGIMKLGIKHYTIGIFWHCKLVTTCT
jgi:hypothetical protein